MMYIIIILLVVTISLTIWKKKYIITGVIGSLSLGLYMYFAHYKQESREQIIVAISPDYAPYAYIENGEIKGLDVDLLRHIEKQLGKEIVFKSMDFTFLIPALKKGEADVVAGGLSVTEEREAVLWKEKIYFTTPYSHSSTGILIGSAVPLNTINKNFSGKILVQSGSLFVDIAKERFPNATLIGREDFNIALEEFKEGKADAIVGDTLPLLWFNNKHINNHFQLFKLKHTLKPGTSKGNAFIVDTKNGKLDLDRLNKIIIQYKKDQKFFQEIEDLKSI